eukprot:scaffold1711_cov235-Skeletonema_marinoi.AAC.4
MQKMCPADDVLIKSNIMAEHVIVMGKIANYAAVKDEHGKEKRICALDRGQRLNISYAAAKDARTRFNGGVCRKYAWSKSQAMQK